MDARDLHRSQLLTVAHLAVVLLAALELEGRDLLATTLLHDLAADLCASESRLAHLEAVAREHQHLGELDLGARIAREQFHHDGVALSHSILFSAGADDCGCHRKGADPSSRPRALQEMSGFSGLASGGALPAVRPICACPDC